MLEQIRKMFKINSEEGATAVEYGIMVALIAAVIIAVVVVVGKQTCEGFEIVSDEMAKADSTTVAAKTC